MVAAKTTKTKWCHPCPPGLFIALAAVVAVSGQDTAACAQNVVSMTSAVVIVAERLVEAAVDCTLPGLDEASCAEDLTGAIKGMAGAAAAASLSTLTCAGVDNLCSTMVCTCIADLAETAGNIIAASSDCINDPFICTFDVVNSVDAVNSAISAILDALRFCNGRVAKPVTPRGRIAPSLFGRVSIVDRLIEDPVNGLRRLDEQFVSSFPLEDPLLAIDEADDGDTLGLEQLREEIIAWRLEMS